MNAKVVHHSRLRIAIVFCFLCSTRPGLGVEASKLELGTVQLKQGCLLKFPSSFDVMDRRNVLQIMKEYTKSSPPEFVAKVNAASLAFAAVNDQSKPTCQVTLLILPPELSQAELRTFDEDRQIRLRDLMHEQSEPQFRRLGISITKKHKPRVRKGSKLTYFFWAYEFTNRTEIPQVSFRAYYYTKKATFVLGISSEFEYAKKHWKSLREVLESFDASV